MAASWCCCCSFDDTLLRAHLLEHCGVHPNCNNGSSCSVQFNLSLWIVCLSIMSGVLIRSSRPWPDGFHFEINCFSIGPCHCQSRCQSSIVSLARTASRFLFCLASIHFLFKHLVLLWSLSAFLSLASINISHCYCSIKEHTRPTEEKRASRQIIGTHTTLTIAT